ncbi:MAG: CpsD/CapB family tyrosine-protein kinase [Rhodobacterales bacterium]|nr:CpsD/CapB family tyrosine-protein kinase [Rhodobacterales bacterium]
MEKIQQALAKARAERNDPGATVAPMRREAIAPAFETSLDVAEAWHALPELTLDAGRLKENRILALEGGREATDIDMMRTRVLQQMRDNGWRRLAITSPTAGCGKSTIALNLALSLHRQSDLRIILMELDLHRPSLADMVGLTEEMSFAKVIGGESDFASNAVRYSDNLAISVNQRPYKNAAELLGGRTMPQVLAEIEENYAPDVMLFDTPPMLVTDDMMAFARHMDCVLLVAGAEMTTTKEVDVCERDLAAQTNVMGVIVNKCRYMGPEYGYEYYK